MLSTLDGIDKIFIFVKQPHLVQTFQVFRVCFQGKRVIFKQLESLSWSIKIPARHLELLNETFPFLNRHRYNSFSFQRKEKLAQENLKQL